MHLQHSWELCPEWGTWSRRDRGDPATLEVHDDRDCPDRNDEPFLRTLNTTELLGNCGDAGHLCKMHPASFWMLFYLKKGINEKKSDILKNRGRAVWGKSPTILPRIFSELYDPPVDDITGSATVINGWGLCCKGGFSVGSGRNLTKKLDPKAWFKAAHNVGMHKV